LSNAFPVSGIRDQNVWSVAVVGIDLLEHRFDLIWTSNIDLVRRDAKLLVPVSGS
jgi:hypothetical protein